MLSRYITKSTEKSLSELYTKISQVYAKRLGASTPGPEGDSVRGRR